MAVAEMSISLSNITQPEFPSMLWRQATHTDLFPKEILNHENTKILTDKEEGSLITRLELELTEIAQHKVNEHSELVGQAVRDGVIAGGIISENILLANLPIPTPAKISIGIISLMSGAQSFLAGIPGVALYPFAKKIGGEVEKARITKSLNRDIQAFLKSECHMDFRQSLI